MTYLRLACAILGVFVGATAAQADIHRLASSKADNIDIDISYAANTNWCSSHLVMRATYDGVVNQAALGQLFPKIGVLLSRECPQATQITWTSATVAGQFVAQGTSDKEHGWAMATAGTSAAAPAPVPAAVPTSAPASIAPALAAAASAPAAASVAAAAPAAVPPAPAPQVSIPPELGYQSMLLRLVHDTPGLLNEDDVLRYWANYRFRREYQAVANQDFKVRPVLAKAKDDLQQTQAQTDTAYVALPFEVQFGNYDFSKHLFPLSISANALQYGQVQSMFSFSTNKLPQTLSVKIDGLSAITGIPMSESDAQAFLQQRTRYGSIDRSIEVIAEVKLASGFQAANVNFYQASGVLDRVLFVTQGNSQHPSQIVAQLTPDTLASMRAAQAQAKAAAEKAREEQLAAQRRQQLLAQRAGYIQGLGGLPTSARLANFMAPGMIDYSLRLNDLRDARGRALLQDKPVTVNMLVQSDGSGRDKIPVRWPGKLRVSVPASQEPLSSGTWYLLHGVLSVPQDDTLSTQLVAETVYTCKQAECADAADPIAIVDHKLAAMGVTPQQ